ncbi:MAG TPA: hypothetical protein VF178_05590 [Gemmatimonadaceae bacterium]
MPLVLLLALVTQCAEQRAPSPQWTIDPAPELTIGGDPSDTAAIFTEVAGATRLPDGHILVGDRGDFALRLFDQEGRLGRRFGRDGDGPGEIRYLKALLRCGDSLVTIDVGDDRTSIFSIDGAYVRAFRFGSPQPGVPPYLTACNRNLLFVHHGWEDWRQRKLGVYRMPVPYWISGADSAVRHVIGSFPGSERYGTVGGAGPLPLGKQPAVAIASDRIYIGTADRYEILVFDLSGSPRDTIRKSAVNLQTKPADIEAFKEREIAAEGERRRAAIERRYADFPFPETVPAYANFVVDADENLWVQDYPRGQATTVTWTVFDRTGGQVAEIALPTDLTVFEIGHDYVLGRWLSVEEAIPQVRMYRLRRSG